MDLVDRDMFERRMARRVGHVNQSALEKLMELLGDPPDFGNVPMEFWTTTGIGLRGAVVPVLEEIFLMQAEALIEQVGFGIDWTLVNQAAVDWAKTHAGELVDGVTETARNFIGDAVADYFEDGLTIGDLRERLERVYGPKKAEEIAQTEVTRAAVEGEIEMVEEIRKSGIEMTPIWQTNNDDLVCPICGPMNGRMGQYVGSVPMWEHPDLGEIGAPPAHPRCRCWVNHEVTK